MRPNHHELTLLKTKRNPGILVRIFRGEGPYKDWWMISAPYNKTLQRNLKLRFSKALWTPEAEDPFRTDRYGCPKRGLWRVPYNARSLFQWKYLAGDNPYRRYDEFEDYNGEILEHCMRRDITLYAHQNEMVNFMLNSRRCIVAGEMGVGKTLATIIAMEMLECRDALWVGPKAPLESVKRDFSKWRSPLVPTFVTYERMVNMAKSWSGSYPDCIVFDESSKLKNWTTNRSQAANALVNEMHEDGCVFLLSGTPSPKKPTDWWSQCEIACPGFIKEGNIYRFRDRLCHVKQVDGTDGQSFQKEHAWKDSPDLCADCGEPRDHWTHQTNHRFKPGENEVEKLGQALKGLVNVWRKKDCLDLPEMSFEVINIPPDPQLLQIAETAAATAGRGCDALIKLRTISDGFRYRDVDHGRRQECEACNGVGQVFRYIDEDAPHDPLSQNEIEKGIRLDGDKEVKIGKIKKVPVDCYTCLGSGQTVLYDREVEPIHSPKLDVLGIIMDEHDEVGRLNVFAGFEGSILRIVDFALEKNWDVMRVDGKGWKYHSAEHGTLPLTPNQMLSLYQKEADAWPDKILFVGQPGAAGMGLTLHAAPTTVFYSNDFNPESRIQACSRGHRIGMLQNGGKIIDLIHLPTDRQIIESLTKSQHLQNISLDAVRNALK